MNTYKLLVFLIGFVTIGNAQIDTKKLLNKQQAERQTLEKQQRSELSKITAERAAKVNGLDAEKRALERDNDKKIADLKSRGFKEGTGAGADQILVSQKRENALAKVDLEAKQAKIRQEANATFNAKNKQLAEKFANQQRLLANTQTDKKKVALRQQSERTTQQNITNAKINKLATQASLEQRSRNKAVNEVKKNKGENSKASRLIKNSAQRAQVASDKLFTAQKNKILTQDQAQKNTLARKQQAEKSLVKRQINERDALMKKQNAQRTELKSKLAKSNVPAAKANKILAKQQKINQRPIQELNKRQAKETKRFNKSTTTKKSSSGIKSKVKKAIKKVTPSKKKSSATNAVKKTTKKKKTVSKKRLGKHL